MTKGYFEDSSNLMKLFVLLIVVFTCAIIGICASTIYLLIFKSGNTISNTQALLFLQNGFLFVLSPFIAQYFLWKAPLKECLLFRTPILSVLLFGILSMMFISPFVNVLATWNKGMHLPDFMHSVEQWMIYSEQQADSVTKLLLGDSSVKSFVINILVVAIMAGIGEELVFRGVLQKFIIGWTKNVHAGILISAFIFSAVHLQFFGFLPRFALGVLLGYMFLWSRSIWVPIIAHSFNNAMVIIVSSAFIKDNSFMESLNNENPPVWTGIISLALVCFFMYKLKTRKEKLAMQKE